MIRLLNIEDVEQLTQLLEGQKSYFGMSIEEFPINISSKRMIASYTNSYLREENEYFRCYGAFSPTGELLGTITADFLQNQPTWILRRIVVNENLKSSAQGAEAAQELMAEVIKYAESVGYYQYLMLIPEKYKHAHLKVWEQNVMRQGRYMVVEMETIPANSPSRFRDYWELLFGRTAFPLDSVVRMNILKSEFRQ